MSRIFMCSCRFIWMLVPVLSVVGTEPVLAQPRGAVYVGAKVCATCHNGKDAGQQTTIWLHSKHARAYASLAAPEARAIAAISGVPIEPRQSPLCLGCHATAANAEDWEKDDTFSVLDGVQCEKCHGPGSEHVDSWSGANKGDSGPRVRLASPMSADCMKCHKDKPSHTRCLPQPSRQPNRQTTSFDLAQALREIAHPTPKGRNEDTRDPVEFPTNPSSSAKYTGSQACGACHDAREQGSQFSRWQLSKHALAFASLATPEGFAIAAQSGVKGDPQSSMACLKCHGTAAHRPAGGMLDSYSVLEGVGCESCHGAGSAYSPEEVMKDKARAISAGLLKIDKTTCLSCHEQAHGKPFDYETALRTIAHPRTAQASTLEVRYKTPLGLAFRPGGQELYVTCEASSTVCVIDPAKRRKVGEIPVGGEPTDLTFSPDGRRAYVTNRLDDSLSVIDTTTHRVISTIPVGDEPHGVRTDASGQTIYVLNTSSDDISVIDAASLKERKRLEASRSPWALALSPDGSRLLVTNALSRLVKFREPSLSEVTVIDTERSVVDDRLKVPGANMLQGVAWHPSGRFALTTLMRSKNLVPMTRMAQGWTVTNGLGVIEDDGRVDQVLLDEPGESFPDPSAVAFTPDGRLALVASATTDRLALIDVCRLRKVIDTATPEERETVLPNHLGKPTEFVTDHIKTGINPRGLAISADGKTAYVTCGLEDTVGVIDIPARKMMARIDLGGPREITKARWGERLFHNAAIAF
ncbi:MAG: multiheme c-type cytochrome, partial [Isosphaeraceae bacterium]